MVTNLPFPALRAFEAVVRLQGFGRAAEELGITQSAVSQHVRMLEDWTGQRLLIRGARRSLPTDDGHELATAIAEGMGRIGDLCMQMRNRNSQETTISVSCLPGFAINWLFPRLIKFDQRHPAVTVSISTNAQPVNFTSGNEDLAIRYGRGAYQGLYVEKLLDENVFPVCAPALLARDPPLQTVADLARHTLLMDELAAIGGRPPSWEFWAEETGQVLPRPSRIRRFGQSNMVVQAAIEGLGVALGRDTLVMDALRDGRLCKPFVGEARSDYAYWFVCPKGALENPAIRAFHDWLMAEAILHKQS